MSKEQVDKWSACLCMELMSSEDRVSEWDEEDQQSAFVTRPLPWRSAHVNDFFNFLEKRYHNSSSQRDKMMTYKERPVYPSERSPPSGLPDWVYNKADGMELMPRTSKQLLGCSSSTPCSSRTPYSSRTLLTQS